MEKLIIVGCGEHYQSNLASSLATMEATKEAQVIATVDLKPLDVKRRSAHAPPHIVRLAGESLVTRLNTFQEDDPIVLLSHSHEWHASDALDLVAGGFRVILEKPYAITRSELRDIRALVSGNPQRIALAEYYLMMKASPLLHAAGLLRSDSFYLQEPGYLHIEAVGKTVDETRDILKNIGRPRHVFADILEGEDATGRLEHRGPQFADTRAGIGVILDLALHALAPLFAIEGSLGEIPAASSISVGAAVCDRYVRFAENTYGVPARFVPETYAELAFVTSTGVPVNIRVGKYILSNENQRRMLIVGDEGEALLDLSRCTLSLARRDDCTSPVLSCRKKPDTKYRAVIRACLLLLRGSSPFDFNPTDVALRCNDLALSLFCRVSEDVASRDRYHEGARPGGDPHDSGHTYGIEPQDRRPDRWSGCGQSVLRTSVPPYERARRSGI